MTSRSPWTRKVSAASLVCLGAVFVPQTTAIAAGCGNFQGVASADGARIAGSSPGFLLVEQADVGAPATQALVDSVGRSVGYAGYPYPGKTVLSVLGVGGVPASTVPLAVQSSYPTTPEGSLDTPGIALSSRSDARATSTKAQGGLMTDGGPSSGLTAATSDVSCGDDGTVTATAVSTAEGMSFGGGVLRLGRVRSIAKVVMGPDGQSHLESKLEVNLASVAGQTVGVDEHGLVLGGSPTPLGDNPLASVLKGSGIEVTYVAGSIQPDGKGVVAPTLQVQLSRQAVGSGPTVTTFTFGRSFASIAGSPAAQPRAPVAAPTVPSNDDAAAAPNTAPGRSGVAGSQPTATGQTQRATGPVGTQTQRPRAVPAGFGVSGWSFYPVLVVAALALLGCSVLVRKLGVKLAWM